jgi:two-component system LytT family response regulator
LKVLIADDEPPARRQLLDLLADVPRVTCVGEAADGGAAVAAVDRLRPDVLFLDIEMPVLSGLAVLERVRHRPAVAFTTAYDRYAVAAFELAALDYLLKPFGRERFNRAIDRARAVLDRRITRPGVLDRARDVLAGHAIPRLFVREAGRIVPVRVSAIERIQAADDYVIVHVGTRQFMLGVPLADLEARLDPNTFLRVHRSHLVNLDHVVACTPREDSRFEVTLRSGATVTASRLRSRLVRALAR